MLAGMRDGGGMGNRRNVWVRSEQHSFLERMANTESEISPASALRQILWRVQRIPADSLRDVLNKLDTLVTK
jgi:hypothetical protein